MTAAACNLQRISRILCNDLYIVHLNVSIWNVSLNSNCLMKKKTNWLTSLLQPKYDFCLTMEL